MAPLSGLGKSTTILFAVVAVMAVACGNAASLPAPSADSIPIQPAPFSPVLNVVTTSNIVGDWVKNVGGERVEVFSLMPINTDPHTFQPGARDVTRVADADLILIVGLSLEAVWLRELIDNTVVDSSKVVALGEVVDPIEFVEIGAYEDDERDEGDENDEHDEHEHGALNPHFWFDPIRVKRAVTDIASRLSVIDPGGAEFYGANARAYNEKLDELDGWIRQRVSQIPKDRRLLVTSHDSFGYFARAYGFVLVGTVFPDGSTERDPSAQEIAELVQRIRASKAPVIFAESTVSNRLAQRVSEETGVQVNEELLTGSLGGPNSGAENYIDFIRTDVRIIVDALK